MKTFSIFLILIIALSSAALAQHDYKEVWVKSFKNGDKAVDLFNRGETATNVELLWSEASLSGNHEIHDLWLHRDLGSFNDKFSASVPGHGAILLRVK